MCLEGIKSPLSPLIFQIQQQQQQQQTISKLQSLVFRYWPQRRRLSWSAYQPITDASLNAYKTRIQFMITTNGKERQSTANSILET